MSTQLSAAAAERAGLPEDVAAAPDRVSERRFRLGIAATSGLALAVAGSTLTREPLWNDEVLTLAVVSRPLGELLANYHHRANGLLYDLTLWPIVQLGGTSSFWLRLAPLVAFTLAVAFTALVGARLANRAVGLVAAFLLAVHPFAVYYAQEARPYGYVLLFSALSAWALLRALERPSRGRFAVYSLATIAVGYSHDFALAALLAHPALVWPHRRRAAVVWGFGSSLGAAAVALSPLALLAREDWGASAFSWVEEPGGWIVRDTATELTGSLASVAVCGLLLVLVGGAVVARRRAGLPSPLGGAAATFLAVWLLAPFAVLYAASLVRPVLVPRYVVSSAIALCLLIASSVAVLRLRVAVAGLAAVVALFALEVVDDAVHRFKADWPGVAALLEQRRAPGELVVIVGDVPGSVDGLLYYWTELGHPRDALPWTNEELRRLPAGILVSGKGRVALDQLPDGSGPLWAVERPPLDASEYAFLARIHSRCATERVYQLVGIRVHYGAGCAPPASPGG